jgi:hypothetical protein
MTKWVCPRGYSNDICGVGGHLFCVQIETLAILITISVDLLEFQDSALQNQKWKQRKEEECLLCPFSFKVFSSTQVI